MENQKQRLGKSVWRLLFRVIVVVRATEFDKDGRVRHGCRCNRHKRDGGAPDQVQRTDAAGSKHPVDPIDSGDKRNRDSVAQSTFCRGWTQNHTRGRRLIMRVRRWAILSAGAVCHCSSGNVRVGMEATRAMPAGQRAKSAGGLRAVSNAAGLYHFFAWVAELHLLWGAVAVRRRKVQTIGAAWRRVRRVSARNVQ